ncbi:MAG: hypothetical protein JWN41_1661 [Thermoleophilia bacterium]|nr:hypothetical protein [Thermoleophilia bacterium]
MRADVCAVPRLRPAHLVVIAATLGILFAGVSVLVMNTHAVLPGVDGCTYVRSTAAQRTCWSSRLTAVMHQHGPRAVLAASKRLESKSDGYAARCHYVMHPVGAAFAREQHAVKPLQDFVGGGVCEQGFAHGYVSTLFERDSDPVRDGLQLSTICATMQRDAQAMTNCMHALGHTLRGKGSRRTADSVCGEIRVTTPATESLQLPMTALSRADCRKGIIMQDAMLAGRRAGVSSGCQPHTDSVELMRECAEYLPARILNAHDTAPWPTVARSCSAYLPAEPWHQICVKSYASMILSDKRCSLLPVALDRRTCAAFEASPS